MGIEQNKILRIIYEEGEADSRKLSKETGKSLPLVHELCKLLLGRKLIRKRKIPSGTWRRDICAYRIRPLSKERALKLIKTLNEENIENSGETVNE